MLETQSPAACVPTSRSSTTSPSPSIPSQSRAEPSWRLPQAPGGVALGLGDIAVAPTDSYVVFARDDALAVGWTESGKVEDLPVQAPPRLALYDLDIPGGKSLEIPLDFAPTNINISPSDETLYLRKSDTEVCVFSIPDRRCRTMLDSARNVTQ